MSAASKEDEPPYRCTVCLEEIHEKAGHYRVGDERVHPQCWASFWWSPRTSLRPPDIGGGSASSPWTLVFDQRIARRAAADRAVFRELMVACVETRWAAGEMRRRSAATRGRGRPRPPGAQPSSSTIMK